jgi:hypothetical protein
MSEWKGEREGEGEREMYTERYKQSKSTHIEAVCTKKKHEELA